MTLAEAAPRLGVKASYLVKLLRERAKPRSDRRYSDALHEYYMTARWVKDTKGRRDVGPGNFPWHIADELVERFERTRALLLAGQPARATKGSRTLGQQLAELGL